MKTEELVEIIKKLNDNRSKLSALYSLYNSSLVLAESNRANLGDFYEQMIDYKNDVSNLTREISTVSKTKRSGELSKNKSKITKINDEILNINKEFENSCNTYRVALKDCGSLKTEYKHEVAELCKEFKAGVKANTDPLIIKGYKQQVKLIKTILDRIEFLIEDYNKKKDKMEQDNIRFNELYGSVSMLIDQLESIA